jgi:hypothetical protein
MSNVIALEFIQLADTINKSHAEANKSYGNALHHARAAGEALVIAYSKIDKPSRGKWLAKHCPCVKPRTAQTYMRIFQEWGAIEARPDIASIGGAKKLLTKPKKETPGRASLAPVVEYKPIEQPVVTPSVSTPVTDWKAKYLDLESVFEKAEVMLEILDASHPELFNQIEDEASRQLKRRSRT